MGSQAPPTTPVRVPKAVTTYTPTMQDPDLRSQINAVLLRDGHIETIQTALHHALHAHPSNWHSKIALHALTLLRSGECTTFPALMDRVMADIKRDTDIARETARAVRVARTAVVNGVGAGPGVASASATAASAGGVTVQKNKGLEALNGKLLGAAGTGTGADAPGGKLAKESLALPQAVINEGVRVTRECLEMVCEIE